MLSYILYKKKSKIHYYKIDINKKIEFYKTVNIRDVKTQIDFYNLRNYKKQFIFKKIKNKRYKNYIYIF